MPMAASQYPATATSAGDHMTGPMIAMGYSPLTGDGLRNLPTCPRPGSGKSQGHPPLACWAASLAGS